MLSGFAYSQEKKLCRTWKLDFIKNPEEKQIYFDKKETKIVFDCSIKTFKFFDEKGNVVGSGNWIYDPKKGLIELNNEKNKATWNVNQLSNGNLVFTSNGLIYHYVK